MRRVLPLVVLVLSVAACGGQTSTVEPGSGAGAELAVTGVDPALEAAAASLPTEGGPAPAKTCSAGRERRLRTSRVAWAAVAKGKTIAYARPGGQRLHVFGRHNVNGFPTVFGVLSEISDKACQPAWYRVQLPLRPNGVTGFVRARDVRLGRVETRIEVDLSARRIDVYRLGRRIRRVEAAVGAPITPTPTGTFYVNQRLVAPDPWGPFGPAALGISAFSPVLQDWTQGGPIAIHGTNDPQSIGTAASHGCLRVDNAVLTWLFREIPAGTPVQIAA